MADAHKVAAGGVDATPSWPKPDENWDYLLSKEDKEGCGKYMQCSHRCCREDDDGVPPGCHNAHCPFSHDNPLLNGRLVRKWIGHIGFGHFDRYRKFWLGIASYVSIFALALTIYGCCALSENRSVIRRTYWAAVAGQNFTSDPQYSMYVGLSTFIFSNCSFVPGYVQYPDAVCLETSISYASSECSSKLSADLLGETCAACKDVANAIWLAAITNVFGLVLATNGAQIRMRRIADVPVQKMIGMGTDLFGCITLANSLFVFRSRCFANLHSALQGHTRNPRVWTGPGFICYVICALAGLVRAVVHWLTPIPSDEWRDRARAKGHGGAEEAEAVEDVEGRSPLGSLHEASVAMTCGVVSRAEGAEVN